MPSLSASTAKVMPVEGGVQVVDPGDSPPAQAGLSSLRIKRRTDAPGSSPGPVKVEDSEATTELNVQCRPSSLFSTIEPAQVERPPPAYVQMCASKNFGILTVNKTTGKQKVRQFQCGSWRHEGKCRRYRALMDQQRIEAALEDVELPDVVYMVLTIDPKDYSSPEDCFANLYRCWDRLRKRMTRRYGDFKYVSTVEVTKKGWPHLNVILVSSTLGEACANEGWKAERQEIKKHCMEVGYGKILWLEPAHSRESIAGYIAKVANRLGREVTKLTQLPLMAKKNFRRIRASQGFLPPVPKNPDITGWMFEVEPMMRQDSVDFAPYPPLRSPAEGMVTLLSQDAEFVAARAAGTISEQPFQALRDVAKLRWDELPNKLAGS